MHFHVCHFEALLGFPLGFTVFRDVVAAGQNAKAVSPNLTKWDCPTTIQGLKAEGAEPKGISPSPLLLNCSVVKTGTPQEGIGPRSASQFPMENYSGTDTCLHAPDRTDKQEGASWKPKAPAQTLGKREAKTWVATVSIPLYPRQPGHHHRTYAGCPSNWASGSMNHPDGAQSWEDRSDVHSTPRRLG